MVEVPLSWKLSISGAEDVKTRLQDLQNQFQRGSITVDEYSKQYNGLSRITRTFTRQADIQKNLMLAQYPALNQLSRGMSAFTSVAHSALSIVNSLNLMFLRQGEDTTALAKINSDIASTQRELNAAVAAGDWSKVSELKSKLQELENVRKSMLKDIDDKKWSDWLTSIASVSVGVGVLTNGIIKALPHLSSLVNLLKSAQFAENFSIALMSIGKAGLGLLGPIAIVAAALYGVTELLGVLMPKEFKELIDRIKKEYNVDDITAHLIAPFEIWKIGILEMIVPAIVDGINALIEGINSINPLKGLIGAIPTINYQKPKNPLDVTDQYLTEQFGANSSALTGNQIPKGTKEIIDQQKTTNDFAKNTSKQAEQMLEEWKNKTTPILAESKDTQKVSTKILSDSYGVASASLVATQDMKQSLESTKNAILAMPIMSYGLQSSLGAISGQSALATVLSGHGNPGGLSGSQVINALHSASGFEGYVNQPTGMIVGEAGGEYVSVTPHNNSRQNGNVTIVVQGSVWSERELMRVVNSRLKSDFQGRNWTNLG